MKRLFFFFALSLLFSGANASLFFPDTTILIKRYSCDLNWQDLNVNKLLVSDLNVFGDANFTNIGFSGFIFGDGSKLTGIGGGAGSDLDWTLHDDYPAACAAGEFVSEIGDTLTCSVPTGGTTTTDTTLDTNAAAQAYYWSNFGTTTTGADENIADDITLTNITQITNRAFSDLTGKNFSLLALDDNAEFDARYKLATIADLIRIYAGIAPIAIDNDANTIGLKADFNTDYWSKYSADLNTIIGVLSSDTNFQTTSDFNSRYWSKFDLNGSFYGILDVNRIFESKFDSNNASRLAYTVIADAPWLTTSSDTNFMTFVDFNSWYLSIFDANNPSRLAYTVIADAPWLTTSTDTNFQTFADFNSWYWSKYSSDLNTMITSRIVAEQWDTNWATYGADFNNLYWSKFSNDLNTIIDVRAGGTATMDVNNAERLWLYEDLNKHFVPYIGTDFDTNMGVYDLRAEDLNSMRLYVNTIAFIQGDLSLTGKLLSPDLNANWLSIFDANSLYYKKTDINAGWYGKVDINAGWYGKQDVNTGFVPYVSAVSDLNLGAYSLKAFGDSNFTNARFSGNSFLNALFATGDSNFANIGFSGFIFGDGSKLTGISAIDTNFQTTSDFNSRYWSKFDLNGSFYGKQDINAGWYGKVDINAGWYGKLDVNTAFVPYIGATTDTNLGAFGLQAFGDSNFASISATAYFGDGSNLTGISSTDTNFQTTADFNQMYQSMFNKVGGVYVGQTLVSHVPNLTFASTAGYVAANHLCDVNYAGSHLCSVDEMIASIRLSVDVVWSGTSWASEGAPGYTANANDCAGYTSNNGAHLASFWNFDANKASLTACNGTKTLACCR